MKVEVQTQPGSVSTLQIELAPEEVSKEWDAIANSFARLAKIPGYRPGKAPRAVIEKRFRNDRFRRGDRRQTDQRICTECEQKSARRQKVLAPPCAGEFSPAILRADRRHEARRDAQRAG